MKKLILFIAVLLVHGYSYAQDPHFSQFFASPLTINPANTGNFSGSLRAALNSRTQLPEFNNPYATKTLSLDAPIFKKYIKEDDKLSVGLLILSDQSGNKLLNDNNIAASVSYSKALDENANHSIAVGFQGISELGQAKNQRDANTPHRFAESILTLGEFVMPYRIEHIDQLLWKYHVDLENNLYLCQNQTTT